MAASEELRHEVRGYFTELMDKERAAKVMAVIPSVDWADLATKQDLEALRRQDIDGLRKDVESLRELTSARFEGLHELTTARFEAIEQRMATKQDIAELRDHIDETLRKQFNVIMTFTVGLVSGGAALIGLGAAVF